MVSGQRIKVNEPIFVAHKSKDLATRSLLITNEAFAGQGSSKARSVGQACYLSAATNLRTEYLVFG